MTATSKTSPTVALRPVRESDIDLFFLHQADVDAVGMGGYTPRPRDEHREHWLSLLADSTVNPRTITVDDAVAGHVSAWTVSNRRQVGYGLDRSFWGRGVATAALLRYLDMEKGRPLWASVADHNVASLRVLVKCDFQRVEEPHTEAHGVTYILLMHR